MKTTEVDLDKQVLGQIYVKKPQCIKGKEASIVCMNNRCLNHAFVCQNKQCQCRANHKECIKVLSQSIQQVIQQKNISVKPLEQFIEKVFQTLIDKLSDDRDELLIKINERKNDITMPQIQSKYLNIINSENTQQLTCQFMHKLNLSFGEQSKANNLFKEIENDLKQAQEKVLVELSKLTTKIISIIKEPLSNKSLFQNSKVVCGRQNIQNITNFFKDQSKIINTHLLYRASENQFSAQKFHQKCDNIPNTITIAKIQFGKVVGGYTPLVWKKTQSNEIGEDVQSKSFIFSLTNNDIFDLKEYQFAVYRNQMCGPNFGRGADLKICDKANQNRLSYASINSSYVNEKYSNGGKKDNEKFSGNPDTNYFKVLEWEVWKLDFKAKQQNKPIQIERKDDYLFELNLDYQSEGDSSHSLPLMEIHHSD